MCALPRYLPPPSPTQTRRRSRAASSSLIGRSWTHNTGGYHGGIQHFVLGGMGWCRTSMRSFGLMAPVSCSLSFSVSLLHNLQAQHSYFSKPPNSSTPATGRMHVFTSIGFDGQSYVFSDKFNILPWCVLSPHFLFRL
jgi:hypothetical protein